MITRLSMIPIYKQHIAMFVNQSLRVLLTVKWITTTRLVCSVNFFVLRVMGLIGGLGTYRQSARG